MTAMTDHPTYNPADVPEAPGDASRYALEVGPGGFAAPGGVAGNVAAVYSGLLAQRIAEAKAVPPPMQEVALKAVVLRGGEYELAAHGVVSGPMAFVNAGPVKRWRKKLGGAFLDSLFRGESAFEAGPDLEAFDALLAFCSRYRPTGRTLRQLNDEVALLVLTRAGLSVPIEQLPHPPA